MNLLRDLVQLGVVEAAAEQFELHLQPAGIADTLDRRRRNHETACRRAPRRAPFCRCSAIDRMSVPACLAALVPRLEHDKADPGIGQVGEIVERGQAGNRDDVDRRPACRARALSPGRSAAVVRPSAAPSGNCAASIRYPWSSFGMKAVGSRAMPQKPTPGQHQTDHHHDAAAARPCRRSVWYRRLPPCHRPG